VAVFLVKKEGEKEIYEVCVILVPEILNPKSNIPVYPHIGACYTLAVIKKTLYDRSNSFQKHLVPMIAHRLTRCILIM
jgi:hypothetical protein